MNLLRAASLCVAVFTVFNSCISKKERAEQLARTTCGSCHVFPEPSLLDKATWEKGVLPEMAFRMGVNYSGFSNTNPDDLKEILKALPARPMATEEEWLAIKSYYIENAPDSLIQNPLREFSEISQFQVAQVVLAIEGKTMLTLVEHDSVNDQLFIGTRRGKLYELSEGFELRDSFALESPPSDIHVEDNGRILISAMGIMDPNDQFAGKMLRLDSKDIVSVIDSIKRPVAFERNDMNNDGRADLIVSAFGNFTGGIICYENTGDAYIKHQVHFLPGTRRTIVRDFDGDGLPDILALITQGDEQITLYQNKGNVEFTSKVLLRFQPVYGSSYFDIYDFNGDGNFDILYTNGDNADYSQRLKPYHGIRIFLNDGNNQFKESYFHPMHGASQAVVHDFDRDGDADIAAISFFPDFQHQPKLGFLYLENEKGTMTPYTTELASTARWISMEIGDFDHDDDTDIVLASLNFPTGVPKTLLKAWIDRPTSLLVLRNTLSD